MKQLHQKYGPVAAFRLGPSDEQYVVSVSEPGLLKKVLKMGSRPKSLFRLSEDPLWPRSPCLAVYFIIEP